MRVIIQTTSKSNELRGLEFRDKHNRTLLATHNINSKDDYYTKNVYDLKDNEVIVGMRSTLLNKSKQ